MVILLDTNVLLHFDFERAAWSEVMGRPVERALTTWVTLHELDGLKDSHPNPRRRDRARRVLRLIESGAVVATPADVSPGREVAFCSVQPAIDFEALGLSAANPDHQLVATALSMRALGFDVAVVSNDVTPRIAARMVDIAAMDMPESLQLPASEEPEHREMVRLRTELEQERSRRPVLVADFGEARVIEIEYAASSWVIPDVVFDQVIADQVSKYPRPSQRLYGLDPFLVTREAVEEEREVAQYPTLLHRWLNDLDKYLHTYGHLHPLAVRIRNDGRAPANDVSLNLAFPKGVIVHTKATVPSPPEPPPPPRAQGVRDMSPYAGFLDRVLPYGTWVVGRPVSPVHTGLESGKWKAAVRVTKIAQQRSQQIDPIWIEFGGKPKSFPIEARMLADELSREVVTDLHVVIRESQRTVLTAADIVPLLHRRSAEDA
jgi:hypothetical protein